MKGKRPGRPAGRRLAGDTDGSLWSGASAYTSPRPELRGRHPGNGGEGCIGGSAIEPLETATDVIERDSGDSPIAEVEELRGLIALGRERGYLTFEQIASTLEE